MATLIKSISGIRGIVGDGLDPFNILKFSLTFGKFCNYGKIVIGRDSRISGKSISNICSGALNSIGCDVIDIGICPTPTVQIYVEHLKADGGIAITASHNPNEWNALKLLNKDGMFLSPNEAEKYFSLCYEDKFLFKKWNELGKYHRIEKSWQLHLNKLYELDLVNIKKIQDANFKVLVDCVNGAGIEVVPKLLEDLNCSVTRINCDSSGIFPRNPEPLPQNLVEVGKMMKQSDFDLGIVVDPDVDRLVLLTENGEPFGEENTIALVTKFVLSKERGNVCVNLSTTRAIDDIAEQNKCVVYRTPVGEINVALKMKEVNAVIGGEGSGGVIYPKLHFGRDALVGIILVLQYLAESRLKLSEVKSQLPSYFILKEKFELKQIDPSILFTSFEEGFKPNKIYKEDGLRLDFDDHWIHIRKSNTEPIVRLIVEASSQNQAEMYMKKYKKFLMSLI